MGDKCECKEPGNVLFGQVLYARSERDRAVGALLLVAWEGIISMSRAAELLGKSVYDLRNDANRIFGDTTDSP